MDPAARYAGGNNFVARVIMRGRLTDRRIEQLVKAGYYTHEAKQARSELRKRIAASKRRGNFVEVDGRLIYSP